MDHVPSISEQVDLIREVFVYAQRFKGKRFVVQMSSGLVEDPRFPAMVRDLSILHRGGINLILVPAAGGRIDEVLDRYEIAWNRVQGIRVSSDEAMPLIKMAAFDVANGLLTQLSGLQVDALMGNWVKARAIGVRGGVDFGNAGTVTGIHSQLLEKMLGEGHLPILPCIGWSSTGKPYNVSSIELAVNLATTLKAEKLFFLTDKVEYAPSDYVLPPEGVVRLPERITRITPKAVTDIMSLNPTLSGTPKGELLTNAATAASGGVNRVHILNGRIDGAILKEIFSTLGLGTMVHVDEFEAIRPLRVQDIPEVLRIMDPNVQKGILVARDEEDIARRMDDYLVFETDGTVRGCCALHSIGDTSAEVAAVAVDEAYGHLGIGAKLVKYSIGLAKSRSLAEVFILTTHTADWFESLGFERVQPEALPEARLAVLNRSRNSRVYRLVL